MLTTRDQFENKRPTQTESEGLEKNIPSKWTGEKAGLAILRQNRLQNKSHRKRHRRTLYITQGKNPSRRHKHCKHKFTQNRSTQIYKENLGGLQDIDSNTLTQGDFNTPLSKMDRSSKQNIKKDIVSLNNTLDEWT